VKLYHGSNVFIDAVDLKRCKPFKDFGRGFYLTSLPEQAVAMARRTTRINGSGEPTVTVFECSDDWRERGLATLVFEEPSCE
jgi:hypothetical protein